MFGARPQAQRKQLRTRSRQVETLVSGPRRSPSEPPTSKNQGLQGIIRNASMQTHCMSITVPPRLLCSAGKATFTTVLSMNAMASEPSIAAARIQDSALRYCTRNSGVPGLNYSLVTRWLQHFFQRLLAVPVDKSREESLPATIILLIRGPHELVPASFLRLFSNQLQRRSLRGARLWKFPGSAE